jgi:hypothetical protein
MSTSFHARVREVVNELESADDIVVDSCRVEAGATWERTAEGADTIRAVMGEAALEGVESYLLGVEHVHVAWHMDDYSLEGEFFLKDVRACLSGNYLPYVDSSLPPDRRQAMDGLKTFEEAPGSGRLVALRVPVDGQSRDMWFYDANHRRLELLDLDYQSYMEHILVMKGVPGWQYLFTDVDITHREFHTEVSQLRRALARFPELFPHHDYGDVRERLEARL